MNNEECLICGERLEYLEKDEMMECSICHKSELSNCRCINGHYVCNVCHKKGMDVIFSICKNETSKNPLEILEKMMSQKFCHMHGPEHHVMVAFALITAYKNAGGKIDDFDEALYMAYNRGNNIPGGTCGFYGACGAGISAGIFIAIITKSNPLSEKEYGLSNLMTSKNLFDIGTIGGPRCCKRNSYISIKNAVDFVKEEFGIEMVINDIKCKHIKENNQCIGIRCPFIK